MTTLLDLVPVTEKVSVAGGELDVGGVTVEGFAILFARFPDVQKLMMGREVKNEDVMSMLPSAIAALIAAGCGYPGNVEAEAVAAKLSLEDQTNVVDTIIRLTLPHGVGPFVARLSSLGTFQGGASIKAQGTRSQKQSKNSSPSDTPTLGNTPPG